MVPRILPCVPFPEPGAPTSSMVRYFISSSFPIFVSDLHGLNLDEGDHHLRGRVSALELEVHLIHRNTTDSFAHVFAAHGFDYHYQVLFRVAGDEAEEAGKFRFKKASIEREFAPGK